MYRMPEVVENFLLYFRNAVNEGLVFELQSLYEVSWPKLTEDYFEKRPWPEEKEVAKLVDNDQVSALNFVHNTLIIRCVCI